VGFLRVLLAAVLTTSCSGSQAATGSEPTARPVEPVLPPASPTQILRTADVAWEHLNPARGDKAPQAATLWGDRNGTVATGYLLKPSDGFRSPPHIHNVSYRGVVIRGLIHNDDPAVDDHWMPAGSYWTQPKGDVHITAAEGTDTLAYIEIDEGPYLVLPVEEAFETGEEPQWLVPPALKWKTLSSGVRAAHLWGDARDETPSGTLLELAPGFAGALEHRAAHLRAVVIAGRPSVADAAQAGSTALEPGSYFGTDAASVHNLACPEQPACILYVRAAGELEVTPE